MNKSDMLLFCLYVPKKTYFSVPKNQIRFDNLSRNIQFRAIEGKEDFSACIIDVYRPKYLSLTFSRKRQNIKYK